MFLVGLPEETRIVETGSQHAFVTVTDQAFRIAIGIEHSQKMRKQFAGGVLDRKILLMIAHYRDQNLVGQSQKFRIEAAEDCGRPLRQVDYSIEQGLVFAPARASNGAGGCVQSFTNLLLS